MKNILLLFGGRSTEHEVSIKSTRFIAATLDSKKYRLFYVGITKNGVWFLTDKKALAKKEFFPTPTDRQLFLPPGSKGKTVLINGRFGPKIDLVFPILHGPLGEDGTVQGLVKLAGVPFVGAGVLGSAVGMDKDVMKRLLKEAGLPIGKFLTIIAGQVPSFQEVSKKIGCPFFVKPANAGSSVGVYKIKTIGEYKKFLTEAFKFDTKIILEEFVKGREIECSVLGNEKPKASLPGEVVVHHDFYSYEAKYLDDRGSGLIIPAKLTTTKTKEVQKMAEKVFEILGCAGMGRVDFFLRDNGRLLVNEINTIPGFTSISMYPKMWAASGLEAKLLLDRLIQLAMEKFNQEQKILTSIKI